MFKNLGNLASLMRQAQQMGGQMQEVAGQLKTQRVQGAAGGGLVEVEANGIGEIVRVRIDAGLEDREMLEDLLPAAINQALAKAKQLHMQAMQSMTEGLNLPGLNEAISEMTGLPPDANEDPS